jgi:phenylalanyl-tRNA synthetase beta chain
MVLDLAGGEVVGMTRAGESLPEEAKVELSVERANSLLGLSLSRDEIIDILKRLGASYEGDEVLSVSIPHERMDLRIEEDLIEEVGRLHGYDKLPELDLPEQDAPAPQKEFAVFEIIRGLLTSEGFSEVYTYSMRNEGEVKLLNALNTEKNFMRTGLVEGLEEALVLNKNNLPLLGKESVDIFEIGNVFTPEEKTYLGIATSRKKKKFDELTSKLSDALGVEIKGKEHGNVFEIELSPVLEKVEDLSLPEYTAPEVQFSIPSAYPFALRDVAVWVPESMEEGALREMIASEAGELLYRIDLFDEYTKEGKTSYAYHLVFQSTTETLSDEEVNTIMERVYGALRTQSGFEIR